MMDSVLTFTLLGLGAVTLLTRCFFFILDRELPFPAWAQRQKRAGQTMLWDLKKKNFKFFKRFV